MAVVVAAGSTEAYTKDITKEVHMGLAYEFNGELFDGVEEFLEAVAHEYKVGDTDLALSALDDHGFTLSDLGVRPEGA